jgi:hypothetical protein
MKAKSAWCCVLALFIAHPVCDRALGADNGCPPCPPCPPMTQAPGGQTAPPQQVPPAAPAESPGAPALPQARESVASPATPAPANEDFSGLGASRNAFEESNFSVAGTGLASAGITQGTAEFGSSSTTSTILPGFLTAATSQSPIVMDRVFFNYCFYGQFQALQTTYNLITNPAPVGTTTTKQIAGFNLNQFDIGVEKSFFGGKMSFYVDLPLLYAADNVTDQRVDGVGDLSAGFKLSLYFDRQTGNAISAGVTVGAPTAHSSQFVNAVVVYNPPGGPTPRNVFFTTDVNPTYLEPWVAGLLNFDRLFVQEYFSVIQPLPDTVATSINNCLTGGYRLYSVESAYETTHWITSVIPIISAQTLVALQGGFNETNVSSNSANPGPPASQVTEGPFRISFPTQVFLTEGCQFGLGSRASIFGGVVESVVGPRAFNIGATAGVNFYF